MNFSQLGFGTFILKINGILLALIFCFIVWNYFKKLEKEKLNTDYFVHHLWRWVVGGIILGRIFSIALSPEIISSYGWYSFIAFWSGGINFYGVLIGVMGIMIYDLHKAEYDFWRWIDILIPSLLIGICLSDLAAFLTGASYGTETNLPWGIQYETFGVETINPVHPVTIYAFIVHILLLDWVLKYGKKFYRQRGKLSIIVAIIFFFAEFFLQFFQGGQTFKILDSLNISQLFSLIIVTTLTIYLRKRKV